MFRPFLRSFVPVAIAAMIALPFTATHAQEVPPPVAAAAVEEAPPAPSVGQTILDLVLSPEGIATIVGVGMSLVAALFGNNVVRRRRLALGVYHAFHIVNDLDAELGTGTLDKPTLALEKLNAWMIAHGWRPLKPGEKEVALLEFKSLHGEEKQRAKLLDAPKPSPA